ncbi:hypothetical protein GGX14DRAFT_571817 [Mycena pura]|uniref:Uncharacterized protein n=1 Tax=Mycena pura TaxID=153505 RepID=A0AAD6V2X2_9AGAR|nr:hypothetical protein GGX14DRAFT_571817 [Mycena pura]
MALRLPAVARAKSLYCTTLLRGWGWGAHLDARVLGTPSSLPVPFAFDAIAIGSVVLGMLLGRWSAHAPGLGAGAVMPGSGWAAGIRAGAYIRVPRTSIDVGVWWATAVSKMVFHVSLLFSLPPLR